MLRVAIVVVGGLALLELGSEFHRLSVGTGPSAAIDLRLRHSEVHRRFAGLPVYTGLRRITYPPQA